MALWGNSSSDESKPKWTSDGNKNADKQNVFATAQGWVLRHYKNAAKTEHYDEILCAMKGLPTALAEATITSVHFEEASYARAATGTVIVVYNELVDVTNGATLTVTASGQSNPTATAAAQTGTNRVEFTFTVPNAATNLSIAAQTISGTIKDAGTNTASDKVFVAGDVIGAGGSGTTKTIAVA
mgnify:FL=1